MSELYREEVPLYGDLLRIVHGVDDSIMEAQGLNPRDVPIRHRLERHGAIRLGSVCELRVIKRLLSLFGMHPVGCYDLRVVNLPLLATAFRPTAVKSLEKNPFRIFVSFLRRDLVSPDVQKIVDDVLRRRELFSPRLLELMERAEAGQEMTLQDADDLIVESLKIFKWHSRSTVPIDDYLHLKKEHMMIADIVCFPSAHINHLTPRTLNIDLVQSEMVKQGLPAKERIEGPPSRQCPILLRQTSFKAVEEPVDFYGVTGEPVPGTHTARFGEVEQRGAAVTAKGRALYDDLLARASQRATDESCDLDDVLKDAFSAFPDTWSELRERGLVYFWYSATPDGLKYHTSESGDGRRMGRARLEDLVRDGHVKYEPITYEDFLPLSAAGIFTSNLGDSGVQATKIEEDDGGLSQLEEALGCEVEDQFVLYRGLQEESVRECAKALCMDEISID
ncbi:related to DUF1338 domain protein [Cephalotrichum gorgonifer]|uniref:2-oxoadipate dioxygenase/decarboxylase n=1 Tax=Cephalotrichum gorgonifer TaxID=2041049 RepID=A0AAE8MR53_9PEZI|nr:related to DUF1338 domain protein [Cephalotrichum gorgonifer]